VSSQEVHTDVLIVLMDIGFPMVNVSSAGTQKIASNATKLTVRNASPAIDLKTVNALPVLTL